MFILYTKCHVYVFIYTNTTFIIVTDILTVFKKFAKMFLNSFTWWLLYVPSLLTAT